MTDSNQHINPLAVLKAWFEQDDEGRVMTVVEDPSIVGYVGELLERFNGLVEQYEGMAQAYQEQRGMRETAEMRLAESVEQLEAYRIALGEAHDQLCGCDRPTNPSACVAPQETWGAFALLADSSPASLPVPPPPAGLGIPETGASSPASEPKT